jgi:hypothetical protein
MKNIILILMLLSIFASCVKNIESLNTSSGSSESRPYKTYNYYQGDVGLLKKVKGFFEAEGKTDLKTGYFAYHASSYSNNSDNKPSTARGNFSTETFKEIHFSNETGYETPLVLDKYKKFVFDRMQLDAVFGHTVKLSSYKPNSSLNTRSDNWADSFYVPKMLNFRYSEIKKITNANSLILKWDKDDKNKNGVFINIEHDPEDVMKLTQDKKRYVSLVIATPDNGQYTITAKDLALFPSPLEQLHLEIRRGGYHMSQFNGRAIAMYIYDKSGLTVGLER